MSHPPTICRPEIICKSCLCLVWIGSLLYSKSFPCPGRSGPYSATVFFSFAYRFNFALCSNPPARTTTFAVCLLACCVTCLDFGHTPRPPSIMGSGTKTQRGEGDCPQHPPSLGCLVKIFALLFTYSAWRDIHPNPED